MELTFVPQPRRCVLFRGESRICRETPVILQMPEEDPRLLRAAKKWFDRVEVQKGPFGLYSQGSFRPEYPFARPEGYLLTFRKDAVQLASQDGPGLFYGLKTLGQWFEMPEHPNLEICDWPDLALRSDYLDMRGIFPKFEKILQYVEEMAAYKLNTLVIEYEDKLPRSRKEFCAASDVLTPEQHRQLLQTAYDNFIEVIPLQQTFGHLEYALKLPEYKHLREVDSAPGEMCPLREGSFALAASLMEETAKLHPQSRYLHLGCDEVWSLGQSRECRASGKTRQEISVEYINKLVQKAVELGKIPIIWHDMLVDLQPKPGDPGHIPEQTALKRLDRRAVVALWLYYPEMVNRVAPEVLEQLGALGIRVIPCCAVRSSDNSAGQNYPCVEKRLRDIDAWCEVIEKSRCNGMINTNWCSTFALGNPYGLFETSRYTAFYAAELCWNLHSDTGNFLERFLGAYHGLYGVTLYGGTERRYDYYAVVGQYADRVRRNRETARLIEIMRRLEYAVPVNYTAFRGDFFGGSEVELSCLREHAEKDYPVLRQAERDLEALLPELLSPGMAKMYLESRSYPNRLFRRELERILNTSLEG